MNRIFSLLPIVLIGSMTLHGIPASASTEASIRYNPARWSPLAPYIVEDGHSGPTLIVARNEKDEITEKALLKYDERGRLIEEVYYDANGDKKGRTVFEYEGGLPVSEKLYDKADKLLSSEVRTYRSQKLYSINYLDASGSSTLTHTFSYAPNQIKGTEKAGKDTDSFTIELNQGQIQKVHFGTSQDEIAKIDFEYNKAGHLILRTRTSAGATERCRHEYDSNGRLKSYTYEIKSGDRWVKSRSLELKYQEAA